MRLNFNRGLMGTLLASAVMALGAGDVGQLKQVQRDRIAGYSAKPLEKPRLGFVGNGVADFWTIAKAGALAAGKELGCEVTVAFPSSGVEDQKRILEDMLIRGSDGISVALIDPKNQVEILDQIAERSILITNDSDAAASPRLCYIGMDNYLAGRLCGELGRKGVPGGGKVAIFIGRLEQENARRRWQGFVDGLLGRSVDPERHDDPTKPITEAGYEIIGTWTDYFDRAKAKANVEDVLSRYPDVVLMTGLFEYNSTLALEVLRQSGKLGAVQLAGFDEAAEVIAGIKEGVVLGTVVQNPYEYGFQSIKMLRALTRGDATVIPPSGIVEIPARTITKDNADAFWKETKARLAAGKAAR